MGRQGEVVRKDSFGHTVPAGGQPDRQQDPPASEGVGGFSLAQLALPGIQPAPLSLQALVDAQREMIAARERFDALWSDALFSPDVLPAFVRPQAS